MIIKVKRIYKPEFVDIKDYNLQEALKEKGEIVIALYDQNDRYLGQKMVVDRKYLKKNGIVLTDKEFPGEYPPYKYKLISFQWKPESEPTTEELMQKYAI